MKRKRHYDPHLPLVLVLAALCIITWIMCRSAEKQLQAAIEMPVEVYTVEAQITSYAAPTRAVKAPREEPRQDVVTEEVDEPESLGIFKVTAYCACQKCCGKDPSDPWYGITATGTKATEGRTIAVDPKVISYGTTVYFEGPNGFHEYRAEDCGGAIKGNDIDLYFDSHEDALEWGVRELEVFCMEEMK